jgi:hypothetical protein
LHSFLFQDSPCLNMTYCKCHGTFNFSTFFLLVPEGGGGMGNTFIFSVTVSFLIMFFHLSCVAA